VPRKKAAFRLLALSWSVLAAWIVLQVLNAGPDAQQDTQRTEPSTTAECDDLARLQILISEGYVATEASPRFLPFRQVRLPSEAIQAHKKDRLRTIRFLFDVTRKGEAECALAAAITALTLEEGPFAGMPWVSTRIASFDVRASAGDRTDREKLIERVEPLLRKAEEARNGSGVDDF
jgi:hypothetical protein